jgi:hypothetical protein
MLFFLDNSLDATLQKYIINTCSPLNTTKIKKNNKNGAVTYETPFNVIFYHKNFS